MSKSQKIFILSILCFVVALCVSGNAYAAEGGVFGAFSERTTSFARQLRSFAFILSGFGIIMFTWAAICGKINFKHLGYIMISLFIVSGVGLLISYITGGDASENLNFRQLWSDSLAIERAGKGNMSAPRNSGLH